MRLLNWQFDDEVLGTPYEWNWLEITLTFDDGSKRWSLLYTPIGCIKTFLGQT
jgi:uncharacterized protein YycO